MKKNSTAETITINGTTYAIESHGPTGLYLRGPRNAAAVLCRNLKSGAYTFLLGARSVRTAILSIEASATFPQFANFDRLESGAVMPR